MRFRRSNILVAAVVLPILAAGGFLFARHMIVRSFPETSGHIMIPGLYSSVEVLRDEFGTPVIEAANEHDLMFALGFVHAQDRLWQMDLGRRAGEGRLSEIFGDVTVPFDRMFRIIGINEIAGKVEEVLSEASRQRLQWYADGINSYCVYRGRILPVEFDLLLYEPDEWTVRSSLLIAQMMAWELNLTWWTEMTLGVLAERLGPEKAREVFPSPDVPAVGTTPGASAHTGFMETALDYRRLFGMGGVGGGSNAWVVAPQKSASGFPILANDTHLHLQIPSKWYQVHLRAPGYDVGGMSIPGVPGIVSGHNADIAWGVTNLMADESDFYIEKVDTADTTKYWYRGELRPLSLKTEEIRVKDEPSVEFAVRSTHHGPVVSDIRTNLQKTVTGNVVTMRWTGAEISDRVDAFNRINRAMNWEEFLEGVSRFSGPGQNFVFADKQGNIGYHAGGLIPVRPKGAGIIPLAGWDGGGEWIGFVPFDRLPSLFNPPEGFIASANSRVEAPGNPYYISAIWEPSSRIHRIHEVVGRTGLFSAHDFERLQNDQYSLHAAELTSVLLTACADTILGIHEEDRIMEYLKNWNYEFSKDDIATAIFQQWFVRFIRNTFLDEMGQDIFHDIVILGNVPIRVTEKLVAGRISDWFDDVDTDQKEDLRMIVCRSLVEAVALLNERFGADTKEWRWGELHQVTLHHPFGLVQPLDRVFDRGPFPTGGGPTTLISGEYSYNEPFAVTVSSSFRMVFDFARPDEIRSILPTGQSGQAYHPNYDDQMHLWLQGAYRTFNSSPRASSHSLSRLTLSPSE